MYIKYNDLSLIGKIWTIRELLNQGIYEQNTDYIIAAVRKLDEMAASEEYLNSNTTLCDDIHSIDNIVKHAHSIENVYVLNQEESIDFKRRSNAVSKVWVIREKFDYFKQKVKKDLDYGTAADEVKILTYNLKKLGACKIYTSKERSELYKILSEVESFYNKCRNKNSLNV